MGYGKIKQIYYFHNLQKVMYANITIIEDGFGVNSHMLVKVIKETFPK